MPHLFKAVVFDLDGTLVDSAPDLHAAANRMLADLGADPVDLETLTGFIGNGVEVLVRRCLAHRDLPHTPEALAPALARFRDYYSADLTTLTRPYPGIRDLLDTLSDHAVPMAICTNKPERPAIDLCAAMELSRHFSVIVGGDTAAMKKPDPAPLRLAIETLGATASETLYVGDSETDYLTARAADIRFAFFEGGYQRRPIPEFAPDYRFRSADALLPLLAPAPATAPKPAQSG